MQETDPTSDPNEPIELAPDAGPNDQTPDGDEPLADEPASEPALDPQRRAFLKKAATVACGTAIVAVPAAAGIMTLLDPLRQDKSGTAEFIKVCTLDAIPDDDLPHKFTVFSDRVDAWNRYFNVPVGAVYMRRKGKEVTCLNGYCPHAGCFVDAEADGSFHCPCHNSAFEKDGSLIEGSVSPRGLDRFPITIAGGIVKVKLQAMGEGSDNKKPLV